MSKIIGISGAQGAGKSTLLMELEERGFAVDHYKVSRAVQAELKISELNRVGDNFENLMYFQEKIFAYKYENDIKLLQRPEPYIFVERSFADIAAWTTHWVSAFTPKSKILEDYILKCKAAQLQIYEGVVLVPLMQHVQFVYDPRRGAEELAEKIFKDTQKFCDALAPYPICTINTKTVKERADQVQSALEHTLTFT